MTKEGISFLLGGIILFILILAAGVYDAGRAQRILPECPIIERIELEESRYNVTMKKREYKYLIKYQCSDGVKYREVW